MIICQYRHFVHFWNTETEKSTKIRSTETRFTQICSKTSLPPPTPYQPLHPPPQTPSPPPQLGRVLCIALFTIPWTGSTSVVFEFHLIDKCALLPISNGCYINSFTGCHCTWKCHIFCFVCCQFSGLLLSKLKLSRWFLDSWQMSYLLLTFRLIVYVVTC